MIKKYITLAALLSAGTALANATTVTETYTITTTFEKQFAYGSYTHFNTSSTLNGSSITSQLHNGTTKPTDSGSPSGLPEANISGSSQYLRDPYQKATNKNINTFLGVINLASTSWQVSIPYGNLIKDLVTGLASNESLRVDSVKLKLGAFTNVSGLGWVWLTKSGGPWDFHVGVELPGTSTKSDHKVSVAGTENYYVSAATGVIGGGSGPSLTPSEINPGFTLGDSSVPTGLTLTFSRPDGLAFRDRNSYVGVYGVELNLSKVTEPVPEPSAFGLLAGLGALALVASRRRRK